MLSLLGASLKTERIQVRVLDLEASPHRFADERFETGIPGPDHGSIQVVAVHLLSASQRETGQRYIS